MIQQSVKDVGDVIIAFPADVSRRSDTTPPRPTDLRENVRAPYEASLIVYVDPRSGTADIIKNRMGPDSHRSALKRDVDALISRVHAPGFITSHNDVRAALQTYFGVNGALHMVYDRANAADTDTFERAGAVNMIREAQIVAAKAIDRFDEALAPDIDRAFPVWTDMSETSGILQKCLDMLNRAFSVEHGPKDSVSDKPTDHTA